jgi:nucleoside-diphosphate-sugar epimerase
MRALVTGATGFIGAHLVESLLGGGNEVRVLVRDPARLAENLRSRAEVLRGDLGDPSTLRAAVRGTERIFHLAGATHALRPAEYLRANTLGTRNLAAAVLREKPPIDRFLYASSLAAAGPGQSPRPIQEDDPPHPLTPYGESKLRSERMLAGIADRIPLTVVRPPIVYGPGDRAGLEFFKYARRRIFPTAAPRDKYYSAIHVFDLVRGIEMAAASPRALSRTYFLAHPQPTTWNGLMTAIHSSLGIRRPIRIVLGANMIRIAAEFGEIAQRWLGVNLRINRSRLGEFLPRFWVCSTEHATEDFGFTGEIDLQAGMDNTVEWYIDNGWI